MLVLKLEPSDGGPDLQLGPAPWFRVSGNFIRQGPNGEIVGTFRRHHWEVSSRQCIVIASTSPVMIHFEDVAGGAGEMFGPLQSFRARDGVLFVNNEPFAKFVEETQLWHCYPAENFWPILVIEAPIS